jgi:hypothetical protein
MAVQIPIPDPQASVDRLFTVLGTIAITALLVAVGLYAAWFGPPANFRLSVHAEDWSRFAEYLGGTLGPVYGLLAFLGLLMTVLLQRRQLADMRAQAEQQVLQQVLATLSGKLDDTLRTAPGSRPVKVLGLVTGERDLVSLRSQLSVGGGLALLADAQETAPAGHEKSISGIKRSVTPEVVTLNRELGQLVQCLQEYQAAGGSESIRFYYLDRYATVVGYMAALQFPVADEVMNAFDLGYAKALVLREARGLLLS